MPETDLEELSDWLEITKQQLTILRIINSLRGKKRVASPKNISLEFKKPQGKSIQKSNLFTQIKVLMGKDFIAKAGKADYMVITEAIKSKLLQRRKVLLEETNKIDRVRASLDTYFVDMPQEKEQITEYLDYDALFDLLERRLRYAREYFIVARFPGIVYTHATYGRAKRARYLETMCRRCFNDKELKVTYITQLNLEHPFERSMRAYNEHKAAYRECELIIKQMENQVKTYENLDIRYLERHFGFDVVIPIIDEINEFFLFIRDEKEFVIGGIHIKSPKTAKKAYEKFIMECKNTKRVRGKYAEETSRKLLRKLREEYGHFM